MAERLVVDCTECGKTFDSPIEMDRGSFESSTLEGNVAQCPHCDGMSRLAKDNMRFESS